MKINKTTPDQHVFLRGLLDIAVIPKRLYFIGNIPENRPPTVAIVGTRKPTAYGREVTTRIAGELAKKGVIIVSGLALGVDALAHQAALDNRGTTIAVQGNGLANIYPRTNRNLGENIIKNGGLILSEYEDDFEATRWSFLERNRLVSALSDAVIITEAASKSGTLNTAAHALEQGKHIFVVPGNITSPLSAGCNQLLRQGATPITSFEDVLEVIAPDLLSPQAILPLGSNALETEIISLITSGMRDGDEIQRTTAAPIDQFNMALTMLEINEAIKALGANQWTIK